MGAGKAGEEMGAEALGGGEIGGGAGDERGAEADRQKVEMWDETQRCAMAAACGGRASAGAAGAGDGVRVFWSGIAAERLRAALWWHVRRGVVRMTSRRWGRAVWRERRALARG